ncbi:hypothetical protein ACUN9W_30850, partial [Escherichia coli]
ADAEGAHLGTGVRVPWDFKRFGQMAASLKAQLLADLADLDVLSTEDLKNRRYQRLMSYGYA